MGTASTRGRVDEFECILITEAGECRVATGGLKIPHQSTDRYPIPQENGRPKNLNGRFRLYLKNMNPEDTIESPTFFVGAADVTELNGYPLPPQEVLELDVTERVQVYVIRDSNPDHTLDADVRTMEVA